MVIFSAGFHLHACSDAVQNFKLINLLGVVGTFLTFGGIWCILLLIPNFGPRSRLVLASSLCATDTIAALSFLPAQAFPTANAIILGEGILNDVVSVVLASSISGTTIFSSMVRYSITSTLCGIGFGMLAMFFGKQFTERSKSEADAESAVKMDSVSAVVFLLLLNYLCYVFAEVCGVSSILALFVSAAISGYNAKSLPKEIHAVANRISEMVGVLANSLVYGYFGLTVWSSITMARLLETWWIILFLLVALIILRGVIVFVLSIVDNMPLHHFGFASKLSLKDFTLVTLGGSQRGLIAYALTLRNIPPPSYRTPLDGLVVSTTLGLVVLNAVLFGMGIPLLVSRFKKAEAPKGTSASNSGDAAQ